MSWKGLEKVHKTFAGPKTDKFRPSCFVWVITFCVNITICSDYYILQLNSVPFKVLKQMFQKAEVHLSRGKEVIVTAPGANAFPERYVDSEGGSPYVV